MKYGLVQMEVVAGEIERNISHGIEMTKEAAKYADIVVLPEFWTIGYDFRRLDEDNKGWLPSLKETFSKIAKENNATIFAGSVPIQKEDGIYNISLVFDQTGKMVGEYSKRKFMKRFLEWKLLKEGKDSFIQEINGIQTGMAICYDLHYPELFMEMKAKNCKQVIVPAMWARQYIHKWDILCKARAIEGEFFVCGVNAVGDYKNFHLDGKSMAVLPDGRTLVEGNDDENIYYAEYNFDLVIK